MYGDLIMVLILAFLLASYSPTWTMTCNQFETAKVRILQDKDIPLTERHRLIRYFKTKLKEPCNATLT